MKPLIDQINAKILNDLLKDGRKSFSEIAKNCNTSSDVIAKRYKQMKKKGIILGATIQNSHSCINGHFIAGVNINIQHGKLQFVTELIKKIPHVINVYPSVISQTASTIVILKDMQELEQVRQSIKRLSFIRGLDINLWLGIRTTPENLSALNVPELENEKVNRRAEYPSRKKTETKIDQIDLSIIEKLALNSRIPFEKIAEPLGVSTNTVVRRYEKLVQSNDVKAVIQINPMKIGYNAYAIFNLAFSHESLEESIDYLAKIPDVNFIIKTSGNTDIILSLLIKNINQFTVVQDQIANLEGTTKLSVTIEKMFSPWPLPKEFISTF